MTDTTVNQFFSFDSIDVNDESHAAVIMYSRYTKASAATKASMAAYCHRFGVMIQSEYENAEDMDLYKKALARQFNDRWDAEIKWITSDEANDDRLTDQQIKSLDAARRKIGNTIKYGGDLRSLDTGSKCEKFNKTKKAESDNINLARELREEGEAVAISKGLEKGTEKFKAFVDEYVKKNTPDNIEGGKEAISPTMVFSQKLGKKLEQLEKSGLSEKEFMDFMRAIEASIDKKLKLCIESAALDSELVQQTA